MLQDTELLSCFFLLRSTSIWDASVILVHYMDDSKQYSQKLHSKRVLELGAGCGLAGIYCSLKVPVHAA
jgi:predicted nicotinamide N-methyase